MQYAGEVQSEQLDGQTKQDTFKYLPTAQVEHGSVVDKLHVKQL